MEWGGGRGQGRGGAHRRPGFIQAGVSGSRGGPPPSSDGPQAASGPACRASPLQRPQPALPALLQLQLQPALRLQLRLRAGGGGRRGAGPSPTAASPYPHTAPGPPLPPTPALRTLAPAPGAHLLLGASCPRRRHVQQCLLPAALGRLLPEPALQLQHPLVPGGRSRGRRLRLLLLPPGRAAGLA